MRGKFWSALYWPKDGEPWAAILGFGGPPDPPPPPPPQPIPDLQAPDVLAAKRRALEATMVRGGRLSTDLTSDAYRSDKLGLR